MRGISYRSQSLDSARAAARVCSQHFAQQQYWTTATACVARADDSYLPDAIELDAAHAALLFFLLQLAHALVEAIHHLAQLWINLDQASAACASDRIRGVRALRDDVAVPRI